MRYEERLEVFDLQKLVLRRERGDLIQFFKFEKNIDKINWLKPITKMGAMSATGPASGLRSNSVRYCSERTRSDTRGHFFKNRVLSTWNYKLDMETVNAVSVNAFKNGVDSKLYNNKNETSATVSGRLSRSSGV